MLFGCTYKNSPRIALSGGNLSSLFVHVYILLHSISNKWMLIFYGRTASGAHVVYISRGWCIQCVFTLSRVFYASLFNKMAHGVREASRRSFWRGRVWKKLGALSVLDDDDGYRILRASCRKSAAVTPFSELLLGFSIWVHCGVYVTWRSCGVHVQGARWSIFIGLAVRGGRLAAKKSADTVGTRFGSSGTQIESIKKL